MRAGPGLCARRLYRHGLLLCTRQRRASAAVNSAAGLWSRCRGHSGFTDYYPSGSGNGENGQTYKTYSDPFATWKTSTLPGTDSNWQTDLVPDTTNGDSYSSETNYDSNGRATDVYKIGPASVTGTLPYSYVHTQTVYGPTDTTWWGEPETVTEDVGGIARVTQTLAYDSSGHATQTEDAAGHIFNTNYLNADYQVSNIVETDCTPNQTLVSYTYGSTVGAIDYGQVDSVTDGLSNVTDSFQYAMSGGGLGEVSQTSESWPWDTGGSEHGYVVDYSYTPGGDRSTTTYRTDNGITEWQYDNYASFGMPQNGGACSRAPQTMRLLDSGQNPTAEEFHYLYDAGGSLEASTFAMTPASGYNPGTGQPWYTETELPSTRARVLYDNSGGGQVLNLNYYWDTWGGGSYNSSGIYGYSDTYDQNTWLKTGATLADFNPHSESYSYDPMLDYLTQATNPGNNGQTENWAYDPAGNRHDPANFSGWTFDNLNRLTASPGLTYSNDILGNRLSNSVSTNGWDQLNRMTSFTAQDSVVTSYTYRSDGMRVQKSDTNGNSTTSAYDGQMGFEDSEPQGNNQGVTDYGIGPRGIDRIAFTSGSGTSVSYPIYDGHGNMTCTLTASGGNYSASNNERQYDAWGGVAYGQGALDPKGRYCASIGHKQDDESALIYMRDRYLDPASGRFISEDYKSQGSDWFMYCANNPVLGIDRDGNGWTIPNDNSEFFTVTYILFLISVGSAILFASKFNARGVAGCLAAAAIFGALALGATNAPLVSLALLQIPGAVSSILAGIATAGAGLNSPGWGTAMSVALGLLMSQVIMDFIAIACIDTGQ